MEGIKKIAMFGGSGMTGLCALDIALNLGLKVKLLLRNPAKLPNDYHEKVEIIHGNVVNLEDVRKSISGVDGVVVVLGTRNNLEPTTEMSRGVENIITAVKESAPTIPVSVCLSSFLFLDPEKISQIFREINAEHHRMLKLLEASDIQYIAVLPPHITDLPKIEFVTKNGQSPGGKCISKFELAEFLVTCLGMKEHYRQKVGLCSKSSIPQK